MGRCQGRTKGGGRCKSSARAGSSFCLFHDDAPDAREARQEGRRAGGRERARRAATLPPDAPPLPLATMADVLAALADTFNRVRVGELDARVGNCLGVLATAIMRGIEGSELVRRIEALEARKR